MKRACFALALVAACGHSDAPSPPSRASTNAMLGGEVAARVDGAALPLSLVAEVAAAQKLSASEAAERVVADAVAAAGAQKRGLDAKEPAVWKLVAARARLTSNRLLEEARAAGPPTDAEVAKLSALHWVEVDRPPAVHVIHAILMRPKDPADLAAIRAAAPGLSAAVSGAVDDADFKARAKAFFAKVPNGSADRVEDLPPMTVDGRATDGSNGRFDEKFAAAAFAIPTVGGMSPVVETDFGWHVIRLVARIPERRMPMEMRRIAFADEVVAFRSHDILEARLQTLRSRYPVVVSDAADALMQSVVRAASSPE